MFKKYAPFICIALLFMGSCSPSENSRFKVKPSALGVMNEIVIITDDDLWASIVGDTTRFYFEGTFPLTPRPEPLFDLRQYEISEINSQPLKKELRTYLVLANLDDESSAVTQFVINDLGEERMQRAKTDLLFNTSVGRNKWANGQILIYIFAHGTDALAAAVERNFEGVASKVNEHDALQLSQYTYGTGRNKGHTSKMIGRYGAEIDIPADYKIALDAPNENGLYWLRKDTKDGAINMAFRIFDYTNPESISKEAAQKRFNSFGRFVSSERPKTYIIVNDVDLPMIEFNRTISARYTKEWRGIWEMENDFMGGPFIIYNIVNETEGKFLSIDSFIFAPGKKKRDMMQQVDFIVKNIKW